MSPPPFVPVQPFVTESDSFQIGAARLTPILSRQALQAARAAAMLSATS